MTLPKLLAILCILLFGIIGIMAFFKKEASPARSSIPIQELLELEIDQHIQVVSPSLVSSTKIKEQKNAKTIELHLPDANRIEELFNKNGAQLPIVETITYK